jgi:glycosyltransferase involved in cell wall biosynthesis
MKILFISQYFYPENFKGNDIVFDFVKKGYDVTVLTGKPNYPKGEFFEGYNFFNKRKETIEGASIIRVPLFPRRKGKTISLILNYISFIFFSYWAVLFRVKGKYDVILVQQLSPVTMALPGLWVKKRKKTPLILWVLDLWPESVMATSNIKEGRVINFLEKLVKKIYANSDVILTSSKLFKDAILAKCEDENKRIEYFPNWAEDIFVKEKEPIEVLDLPKGFNIMFAGNIGESQDFESILKAAKLTKGENINWIVVGDGRKISWIKKEIEQKQINNVYLLGRHRLESMPDFFKKADAMLVSLKDQPIFALTVPAKVQAYMASGKIILGMLNGEGKELINESECGFAVPAESPQLLVQKIVEVSELSLERKIKMEENSLKYYNEHFSKEKLFLKLDVLFQELKEK